MDPRRCRMKNVFLHYDKRMHPVWHPTMARCGRADERYVCTDGADIGGVGEIWEAEGGDLS